MKLPSGYPAKASPANSSRFFELDATAWTSNAVCVLACNASNTAIDPDAATPSVAIIPRLTPNRKPLDAGAAMARTRPSRRRMASRGFLSAR